MANHSKDELRKQLQEVQQKISKLEFDNNGNPVDREYAQKLSDQELDLIMKVYGDTGEKCRVCGCTDNDCRQCIEKTGHPCFWVEKDLCSACVMDKKLTVGGTDKPKGKNSYHLHG